MVTGEGAPRLRVEIEASRPGVAARRLAVTAPAEASTGTVLDVLGAHLGLVGAAGAVQARSLISGAWLDRSSPIGLTGLLRGERLSLVVGLAPGEPPRPLTRWPGWRTDTTATTDGRIPVNRPPRTVRPEPAATVHVPSRNRVRKPRRFPLAAMLVPLLMGLVLVVFLRRWEIALFSLFSPVMVVWNHLEERRAHQDEVSEFGRSYDDAVAATFEQVRAATADWTAWMHKHHPAPGEVTDVVRTAGDRLWERVPGDPDFLHVRLGTASRRAPVTLRDDQAGAGPRTDRPDYEAAAGTEAVPAHVDLAAAGVLAVHGDDGDLDRVGDWILAQVTALHSPADVVVAGALSDASTREWWQWLPHLATDLLPCSPVAADRRSADALLEAVADLGAARRAARDSRRRTTGSGATLLVVVDDRLGPDPSLLRAVCEHVGEGICVVWLGRDARSVPTSAPVVLAVEKGGARAELVDHTGGSRLDVTPDRVGHSTALDLSTSLAALRDAADARQARSLPERLSLEDLVPDLASPAAIRRRWESAPVNRLVARLGVSTDGPVELDLGPEGSHALVGGTTGAGKSELLQTMVASLAAEYPPSRVGFLLVDYKGGAAFKDAQRLPHCVGVVTDLDEHLTRRVLQALDAEIRRREELLAGAGARDLTELRAHIGEEAPEDLLIVVDEFATLAKEIPEFVEGVVDIAARGRSLGLRLVLATQRPAGVINDRIRANVGVRVALRLNDEADSHDVIGQPEAAHVPRTLPGRAYLKVHRHVIELQSAYVGGEARTGVAAAIQVHDLDGAVAVATDRDEGGTTVLEAVVDATLKVAQLGRWRPPHVPWLPPLPAAVPAATLSARAPTGPWSAVLGLADLPRRQSQPVVTFDLARHQGLLVFGTSRSGKTTALRTLAAGMVEGTGPEHLQLYGLDFAGHGLHVLEGAPHCGGVVGPDDPGRVDRLLNRLGRLVEERKRAMASAGLTGFDDLARAWATPVPRVVVLLDGYGGAASALERLDGGRLLKKLERLVADGPSVGVHFLITADRRAAVPSALVSVLTTRLVLRMAEREEYALLGLDSSAVRAVRLPPGRGFIQGSTEVQVAVLASGDSDVEHRAILDVAERARSRWPDRTPPLAPMPPSVGTCELPDPVTPWVLPFAIGDAEVAPVALDLSDAHALVAGPPRSGRTTVLDGLAVAARRAPSPVSLVRIASRRRHDPEPLAWDVGPVDAHDSGELTRALATVSALASQSRPVLCLVDDADALPDSASSALADLARRGRDELVRVVAAVDNRWAARAYGGVVPEVRKSKLGVLLAPEVELDGDLVGVRLRTPLERLGPPGRGYLVQHGVTELVQVAQFDDDGANDREGPSAPVGALGT
ncbi:hypothetical protein EXE59_00755 [Nocardioides eburneiflavus]|uniref:FtsK domain-containing protein n=1 Tax=Nocardioides eburneiflavus TaxID=2518372 RepID=A0A4Z1C5S4_9ACTN|nr:FtsK/SpoIIIE domain-containing protein [Nocardioides eburneiflavus]TGN62646.1 hypothetical protein EXE59_00755 [Nocardioides eburneiflavus]